MKVFSCFLSVWMLFTQAQLANKLPDPDNRILGLIAQTYTYTVPLNNLTIPTIDDCMSGNLASWVCKMMFQLLSDTKNEVPLPDPSLTPFDIFWCNALVQYSNCDAMSAINRHHSGRSPLRLFQESIDLCVDSAFLNAAEQAKLNTTLSMLCKPYTDYAQLQGIVSIRF